MTSVCKWVETHSYQTQCNCHSGACSHHWLSRNWWQNVQGDRWGFSIGCCKIGNLNIQTSFRLRYPVPPHFQTTLTTTHNGRHIQSLISSTVCGRGTNSYFCDSNAVGTGVVAYLDWLIFQNSPAVATLSCSSEVITMLRTNAGNVAGVWRK